MEDRDRRLDLPREIQNGETLPVTAVLSESGRADRHHEPVQFYVDSNPYEPPVQAEEDGHATIQIIGLTAGTHRVAAQVVGWTASYRSQTVLVKSTKKGPRKPSEPPDVSTSGSGTNQKLIVVVKDEDGAIPKYDFSIFIDGTRTDFDTGISGYAVVPLSFSAKSVLVRVCAGGYDWESRIWR